MLICHNPGGSMTKLILQCNPILPDKKLPERNAVYSPTAVYMCTGEAVIQGTPVVAHLKELVVPVE